MGHCLGCFCMAVYNCKYFPGGPQESTDHPQQVALCSLTVFPSTKWVLGLFTGFVFLVGFVVLPSCGCGSTSLVCLATLKCALAPFPGLQKEGCTV